MKTKELQEWLCLHGILTEIDDIYGPKTERALNMFIEIINSSSDLTSYSKYRWLSESEIDIDNVIEILSEPLTKIIDIPDTLEIHWKYSYKINVLARNIATQHLKAKPREVGGANRGPWVRYYTRGYEGREFKWCAGFLSTIIEQAYNTYNEKHPKDKKPSPFQFTLSCNELAQQAQASDLLMARDAHLYYPNGETRIKKGHIFLIPKKEGGGWMHTGIVDKVHKTCFETIEGNATDMIEDEADRVCRRVRSIDACHFIKYPKGH